MFILKTKLTKILKSNLLARQKLLFYRFLLMSGLIPKSLRKKVKNVKNHLPKLELKIKIHFTEKTEGLFLLNLKSYGDKEIFYGNFEPATVNLYEKILKTKKVVWDIGSNIGFYTVLAGIELKDRGSVYAFEPVPMAFKRLQKNIALNDLVNIYPFNWALSDHDGESEIYLLDVDFVTSSPTMEKEWAQKSNLQRSMVIKTRSPQSMLKNGELIKPDMIKIDAETHEPIILNNIRGEFYSAQIPRISFQR